MKNYQSLMKELHKGDRRKLYVFFGEERNLMLSAAQSIDSKYKTVDSLADVEPTLKTRSLLAASNTYMIFDKSVTKRTPDEIKALCSIHTLIFVVPSVDSRLKFFKTFKDDLYEFTANKDSIAYVEEIADNAISKQTAAHIARICGYDTARISNEMHKLQYLAIPYDELTIEDLFIVHQSPENRLWEFIDALVLGKYDAVWTMYKDLKDLKESELKFISLLFTAFRTLFLVQSLANLSDKEIAAQTKLNAWMIKKQRPLIGKRTDAQLYRFLKATHTAEIDIKTGRIPVDIAFKHLMFVLCY